MTILPPLTPEEYVALKKLIAEMEAAEADYREKSGRRGFEDADAEPLRDLDDYIAVMRAAVEGYEAIHKEDR